MANWFSSGRLTNPTANQLLVDTGPLSAGTQELQVIVSATVDCACELQHRDAANAVTLKSQVIAVRANECVSVTMPTGIPNAVNERFRVIQISNITGSMSASIIT